ncbi:HNH endonuclease [Paenibacillus tundrae]|uniref:HNH restriction endonuclease n=1 Tax=Paenibacillus tundrae TaxID=528187 RepID=A0ABT9WD73_9BACL|nr:HNH endonuclease [Paenibacillus tundrae]MDQ0171217.1 putative HNH restriction endonuclease [Paenibacillus tundrae]
MFNSTNSNDFELPLLKASSGRDREIKQFGNKIVEDIIFHHLFLDKDHRSLDIEILNKLDGSTQGRVSANILYYFGIKGVNEYNKAQFKGILKNFSLYQGIEILEKHLNLDYPHKDMLVKIIQHLKSDFERREEEIDVDYIDQVEKETVKLLHSNKRTFVSDEIKTPPAQKTVFNGRENFSRNARIAVEALMEATFKCEVNHLHYTFISKKHRQPYVEAHHLVPMKFQDRFPLASLDTHANVVSLCPNCHRLLHHGIEEEYIEILETLLNQRHSRLIKCGIEIKIEELNMMYSR